MDHVSASYRNFPYKSVMATGFYHTSANSTQSRKSRICAYCHKVFTRSTTRRYHEAKCKIKEMGEGGVGTSKTQISPVASSYATTHSPLGYRIHSDVTTDICNNNVPLLPKSEFVTHAMSSTKQYRPDNISIVQNFIAPPQSALFEDVSPVNSSPALPPVNWLLPSATNNAIYTNHLDRSPDKTERDEKMGVVACHDNSRILVNTSSRMDVSTPNNIAHQSAHNLYQCHICGSTTPSPECCRCFERGQSDHKPYSCIICLTQFTRKYSLKLHEKRHLPPFSCNYCEKQFYNNVGQLKDHLVSHNQPDRQGNGGEGAMTDSFMKPGDIKQEISCSDDEVSDSNDNSSASDVIMKAKIGAGKREMDSVADVQKCNQCGQEFAHAYLLKVHVKIHATKPFECPVCGKKFGYRNNMKTHIKCHYGTKAHACDRCGARFTRASTLRRHIEKHFTPEFNSTTATAKVSSVSGQIRDLPQSGVMSHVPMMSPISVMNQLPQASFVHAADANKPCWLPISINAFNSNIAPLATWPFSNAITESFAAPRNFHDQKESTLKIPLVVETFQPQTQALNLTTSKSSSAPIDDKSLVNYAVAMSRGDSAELQARSSVETEVVYSPDTISFTESKESDASMSRQTRDVHIQVNSCHCSDSVNGQPEEGHAGHEEQDNRSYDKFNVPGLETPKIGDIDSTEQADSLTDEVKVSSQLFPCIPCGIYFCDYAMLKIHRRLHAPGIYRMFVCALCGEDCHDKVYFSLHINEHLK